MSRYLQCRRTFSLSPTYNFQKYSDNNNPSVTKSFYQETDILFFKAPPHTHTHIPKKKSQENFFVFINSVINLDCH